MSRHRFLYVLCTTLGAVCLILAASSTAWASGFYDGATGHHSSGPSKQDKTTVKPGGVPVVWHQHPTPPPPPPEYVPTGSGSCAGAEQAGLLGTCYQNVEYYVNNPICHNKHSCSPENFAGCVTSIMTHVGLWFSKGTLIMVSCPPSENTAQYTGPTWSYGISGAQLGVYKWVVNYAGHSYTFPGSGTLDTGYAIRDDCTGHATTGTVGYWLGTVENGRVTPIYPPPGVYDPPSGWQWVSPPPAQPPAGPYTSTFTVPACPASDQVPPEMGAVPGPGPDLENNDAVDANGNFFTFDIHPVPENGDHAVLHDGISPAWICFDNGYATIGPKYYSRRVHAFGGSENYPRWQFSRFLPPTPYSIVDRYTDPELIVRNRCGPLTASQHADSPEVGAAIAFHAPTNEGNPYRLTIHATYTAYWGTWFIDVMATAEGYVNSSPIGIWRTVAVKCLPKQHPPCSQTQYASPPPTWHQPVIDPPGDVSASALPTSAHTRSYAISGTLKVAVVAPMNAFSNQP